MCEESRGRRFEVNVVFEWGISEEQRDILTVAIQRLLSEVFPEVKDKSGLVTIYHTPQNPD